MIESKRLLKTSCFQGAFSDSIFKRTKSAVQEPSKRHRAGSAREGGLGGRSPRAGAERTETERALHARAPHDLLTFSAENDMVSLPKRRAQTPTVLSGNPEGEPGLISVISAALPAYERTLTIDSF